MFNMFISGALFVLVAFEILGSGRIPKMLAFFCLLNLALAYA